MEGKELLVALGRTTNNLKLLSPDGKSVLRIITPQEAIAIVATGPYLGMSRGKRQVKAIRKCEPRRPDPVWQDCYRTNGAAVLPPSADWFAKVR